MKKNKSDKLFDTTLRHKVQKVMKFPWCTPNDFSGRANIWQGEVQTSHVKFRIQAKVFHTIFDTLLHSNFPSDQSVFNHFPTPCSFSEGGE